MSRTVVMPSSKPSRTRLGREPLRRWYRPRGASYPWRRTRDPYAILVSEIMLQQTQASRVVPAYRAFVRRFPTVRALARAPRRAVILAWEGLGYNRRAVWLSEAARAIVRDHGGVIPERVDALRALPGVGPYTAAAVASIAFERPIAVVDTNVRRVVARVHLGVDGHDAPEAAVWAWAEAWLDRTDPVTWNQAVMDLGREVCRPTPRCDACPLAPGCRFRLRGVAPARRPGSQGRFHGSSRQLRGAIVRALRTHPTLSIPRLAEESGSSLERVRTAVEALVDDGLVVFERGRARLAP